MDIRSYILILKKSNAFKYFYESYDIAQELNYLPLIKQNLLAIFEYYHFEIAQSTHQYNQYVEIFENLTLDDIDELLLSLYKTIFYSQSINEIESAYFKEVPKLTTHLEKLPIQNRLRPKVYFEIALMHDIEGDYKTA